MGKSKTTSSNHCRYERCYAVSPEDKMIYRSPNELALKLKLDRSNVTKVIRGERNCIDGKHLIGIPKNDIDIFEYKKKTGYRLSWIDDEEGEK